MRRGILSLALVCALLVLAGCFGGPAPSPSTTAEPGPVVPPGATPAEPLPLDQLAAFSGVATMNAGSNCTGTLLDTGVPTRPAYILTNGHCVGDVGRAAQQTTLDLEWFGTAEFLRAEGNLDSTLLVEVAALEYSTMRHTDTAIVRLEGTLGDLEAFGIAPIAITPTEPTEGDQVVNIGVPVQNLDMDDWVMRRGDCTLAAQHTIIEFFWLWFGVWANDCPGVIQGSSGSPLLSVDAAGSPTAVVGLINTTSWGVSQAMGGWCFINRPCQVSADGVEMVEQTSYAQSVAGIGSCFDASTGEFAIGGDCPLPVSNVWAAEGGGAFRGGDLPDATGRSATARLVGAVAGSVQTALVPLGDGTACLEPSTYVGASTARVPEAGDGWEQIGLDVPVQLSETEGWYTLCAAADGDYEGAASVLFEVDLTPPLLSAGADIEDLDGSVLVRPHLDPPELSNVRFTWGDADTVDCDDTASFQDFFIVPLLIEGDDLPAVYCVYGMDNAGNRTPVTEIDIPVP